MTPHTTEQSHSRWQKPLPLDLLFTTFLSLILHSFLMASHRYVNYSSGQHKKNLFPGAVIRPSIIFLTLSCWGNEDAHCRGPCFTPKKKNFYQRKDKENFTTSLQLAVWLFSHIFYVQSYFCASVCAYRTETQTFHTGLQGLPSEDFCATANHYQVNQLWVSLANTFFFA